MQIATETKHVVSLTIEDIRYLLRAQRGLEGDIEVKIVEQEQEENPWIDVPKGWDKPYCPDNDIAASNCEVDAEFRDGATHSNILQSEFGCFWKQDGTSADVIRYRKAKE